jgi:hypothetical protein
MCLGGVKVGSTLGPNCSSLDGTYLNEGVTTANDGVTQPLLLTSVLNIRSNARTVSLTVNTLRLDQHGDAFVTLDVALENNISDLHRLEHCYFIKRTLACTEVSKSGWAAPYIGFGGAQSNVYFTLSHDRSLVAKLQNYHVDIILVIPVFEMKEPWALFKRAEQ